MSNHRAGTAETVSVLTIREAADLLKVHVSTLRRWEKAGLVESFRLGPRGHRRFRRDEVIRLLVPSHTPGHSAEFSEA